MTKKTHRVRVPVHKSNLRLIGLSLALSGQAAGHGVNLALAARHAIEDVDVEMLLDDIPDLVVLALLQVPLQQLVRVAGDTQDKLAGAEVQQRLVASHVLPLGQAGQDPQVIFVVTLLITGVPEAVHVHKQRVEDLGQLRSVTVQHRFYELLQAVVVNRVQLRVSLLAVGRQHHVDVGLVLPSSCWRRSLIGAGGAAAAADEAVTRLRRALASPPAASPLPAAAPEPAPEESPAFRSGESSGNPASRRKMSTDSELQYCQQRLLVLRGSGRGCAVISPAHPHRSDNSAAGFNDCRLRTMINSC
ncbi:hypothetical protein EYF80_018552 [Liparis tanakae]|uniref:Uncharacterized protein n=1 Tax=Liparis tanakae TaxID=230148 RepID=A0A4Z2I1P8_9TELE|nr:hypothetical protein EYF80_018552 [Liparis tanakae]